MSTDIPGFVDPDEAIDRINAVFGPQRKDGAGHRALHAKGRFFSGTFTATAEASALSRAGHLRGDPVPVSVRWSNGSGHPRVPDGVPDVRGMAVSFRLPDGTATDLLGQTAPRFPVRTAKAFLEFVEASRKPVNMPLFLLRHRSAIPAMLANIRAKAIVPPSSYAEVTFFPIHAYRWVAADGSSTWVRFELRPLSSAAPAGSFFGRNRLQEEIVARLALGPVRYDLWVTVAAPGDDPHDPMSVWKGARSFSAGVISIEAPDPQREQGDEVVVFDPTRVVDGIELSDDPILRYRPLAYSASVERRT